MKKTMAVVILGAVLFLGCSRNKTILYTPQGVMKAEKNGEQVSIETKEGKATYGKMNVSGETFGVPIYPGATQEGGMSFNQNSGDYRQAATMTFKTKDSADKVIAYYKQQVPAMTNVMDMSSPEGRTFMGNVKTGGKETSIAISMDQESKETLVVLSTQSR